MWPTRVHMHTSTQLYTCTHPRNHEARTHANTLTSKHPRTHSPTYPRTHSRSYTCIYVRKHYADAHMHMQTSTAVCVHMRMYLHPTPAYAGTSHPSPLMHTFTRKRDEIEQGLTLSLAMSIELEGAYIEKSELHTALQPRPTCEL
mmetsp:Transcript_15933/g.26491  ORF Transcript_15933/g.26491 Transcript_15933/m.26491 type:complete len:145 (+) Transcript_15933:278-712(+)